MENIKKCPFSKDDCISSCSLYIKPEDMNETVKNKLASIGVMDKVSGLCAIKNLSLCMSRYIFENSVGSIK